MWRRGFFSIFFVLLAGCSGLEDAERGRIRRLNATGEYIYRTHDEVLFAVEIPRRKSRPHYPWDDAYIGKHARINKEFFRCKGSSQHAPFIRSTPSGPQYVFDCGGMLQHSLPLKDRKEFIYPALIELLNYIQKETEKKVIITCGYRCPTHNSYAASSPSCRTSKHMIGAEVDFYVEGLEWQPDIIVSLIQAYYQEAAAFGKDSAFYPLKRSEKSLNVTTAPWYNKEIFVKLFQSDEGRDLDNNHPFPYICIQLKWDRDTGRRISYSWSSAFNNYLRY